MTKQLKTCVYAIALNEIKHVDAFIQSCSGADLVLVCDTGSTDGTPERLRELGATVWDITQRPWRFDVPRNTALSLIPEWVDVCLSIDLDEHLQPGWVEALNAAWVASDGKQTRFAYDYIWSWMSDGVTPDVRFNTDKIHHRRGYRWRHPCHETLYWEGDGPERSGLVDGLVLHHRPDPTKSRSQYLPLLKMAVDEAPTNDRMAHYYARELMFHGEYPTAIREFERHLALPTSTWREERCASMRYLAKCHTALERNADAIGWAHRAVLEWSAGREPWLDLALTAYRSSEYATGFWAVQQLLAITTRTTSYMGNGACWGAEPYDIGAICAYHLGLYGKAVEWGTTACELSNDERMRNNLTFYKLLVEQSSDK